MNAESLPRITHPHMKIELRSVSAAMLLSHKFAASEVMSSKSPTIEKWDMFARRFEFARENINLESHKVAHREAVAAIRSHYANCQSRLEHLRDTVLPAVLIDGKMPEMPEDDPETFVISFQTSEAWRAVRLLKIYDELFIAALVAVRCALVDETKLPEDVSPRTYVSENISRPALKAIRRYFEDSKANVSAFYDVIEEGRAEAKRLWRKAEKDKAKKTASDSEDAPDA